jgi:hypothetical protein
MEDGPATVLAVFLCYTNTLVVRRIDFDGSGCVMPAQAGIQNKSALASGYASWIPAFAGMTLSSFIHPLQFGAMNY